MRLIHPLGWMGVQGRGVHVSLGPRPRPMDQQGARCHPYPTPNTSFSPVFRSQPRIALTVMCSTGLLYDQIGRINGWAHGSQRNISRFLTNDFQRIKMLMGVFSGNARSPIHTWAIRSEIQPSQSCPDPSAVHINVKLHQSPTHPPSQVFFFSTSPSLYQISINVILSCTCLH